MSKKHFVALATALRGSEPKNDGGVFTAKEQTARFIQWQIDVENITSVCARFNPNFDRARFLKACGVEA